MALITCPECGKNISDKATSCPFCGCPSTYFSSDMNDNDASIVKFNLLGNDLIYKKGAENIAKTFGTFVSLVKENEDLIKEMYRDSNSIEKVLADIPMYVNKSLDSVIEAAVNNLYGEGIIISPVDFINKYEVGYDYDYAPGLDYTVSQYMEILGKQSELEYYRNVKKASRGRWKGGGFGITGAIKGALTASVMNAGSDIIHAYGDISRRNKDNKLINKELLDLYNDKTSINCICNIKQPIMHIFYAYMEELLQCGSEIIEVDVHKAYSLYENTMKYEKDEHKKIKNIVACIGYYPGESAFYKDIEELLYEKSKEEFIRFIDFWGIHSLVPVFMDKLREEE